MRATTFHIEGGGLTLADIDLGDHVTLQLVRDGGKEAWEVWAVKIGEHVYRAPHDLQGDTLHDGPFAHWLNDELSRWQEQATSA